MPDSSVPPRVVVVSENAETVDGLQTYFVGLGIAAQSSRTLEATGSLPDSTTAVVVFPDGFRSEDVLARVQTFHVKWPRVLLLLITENPQQFAAFPRASTDPSLLVLPKPAFGWNIVDAIRLHAATLSPLGAP